MADGVGRTRHGRETQHGSVRRERAANNPPPRRRRRVVEAEVGSSSQAQEEEFDYESQINFDMPQPDVSQAEAQVPQPEVQGEPRDQGFGGGPYDSSLLPLFSKHIAAKIWVGNEREKPLKCINNGNRIIALDTPDFDQQWFWTTVRESGLYHLRTTNYTQVDHSLCTAFSERWHKETSTFHLPIGEMTITLDDVSCLLHLPISGKLLDHMTPICKEDAADMMQEYLGVDMVLAMREFDKLKGAHITFRWLEEIFHHNVSKALELAKVRGARDQLQNHRARAIRCYLLYLVGCTIFTDKSAVYVDVVYLQYFQDLSTVHEWAWGASALAYLYNYLSDATKPSTKQLAGHISLLQAWIMEHFPSISPRDANLQYDRNDARAGRFIPGRGHRMPDLYRAFLDRMVVDDCIFSPYDDYRDVRPLEEISWYSGWIRCGFKIVTPHLPERVLRQYGHRQMIPRHPPAMIRNVYHIDLAFQDFRVHVLPEEMRGPRVETDWEANAGYIAWFYKVSHPILSPAVEGNPPRPANFEQLIEEENASHTVDTLQICTRVHRLALNALESGVQYSDHPLYTTLENIVTETTPATQYHVRRQRRNLRHTQ